MTPEEKARAYDLAFERASKLRFQNPFDTVTQMMEHVFPELKESEDEKIRKAILNYFTKCWGNCKDDICGIHVEDILAWLEKQGQQKQEEIDQKCEPFRIKKGEWYVCIHDFCNKAIRIGEIIQAEHDDTIRGIGFLYMENKYFRPAFENEIPQKSKWTDEDEELLQHCCGAVVAADYYTFEDKEEMTNWFVSLKQRIGG